MTGECDPPKATSSKYDTWQKSPNIEFHMLCSSYSQGRPRKRGRGVGPIHCEPRSFTEKETSGSAEPNGTRSRRVAMDTQQNSTLCVIPRPSSSGSFLVVGRTRGLPSSFSSSCMSGAWSRFAGFFALTWQRLHVSVGNQIDCSI